MTRKSLWLISFSLLVALAGLVFVSTKPQPLTFPFARPIQQRADYRPPGEGVTLYPTDGPFGVGVIQTIAVSSRGTLFVGTYGDGLFRSDDGGARWQAANFGLGDKFITNLTSVESGVLFAGTIRAGLFKSRDNGDHWTSANKGLENTDVESMTSLSGGRILAGTGQGVFISRDEGEQWEAFNDGLTPGMVRSIVADKEETLYAATQGKGIFKRKKGEARWTQVLRGFSFEGIEENVVRALVLGKDGVLYAGTMGAGVFRSPDGGRQWQRANAGLSNISVRSLSVDGAGVLYAGTGNGVFYSENGGARWLPMEGGMDNLQVHSFVVSDEGDLYAGTGGGLYRGKIQSEWKPLHEGLLISPIRTLDYGKEGLTVGTDGKGTFISKENNWAPDNVGLVNLSVRAMARGKTFLYIVTDDGIYRRQHERHRWDPAEGLPPARALSIGVDDLERVYAGTEQGVFASSDHGKSWHRESGPETAPIEVLAVEGKEVLAAAGNTVWIKSEGGWKKVLSVEGSPIRSAAWGEGKTFFIATDGKIWQGDPGGKLKELKGDLPSDAKIYSFAVDPQERTLLYIGLDRGLFWSGDLGITWHPARLYHGERFSKRVNHILPTATPAVWVATEEEGVMLGIEKIPKTNRLRKWLNLG